MFSGVSIFPTCQPAQPAKAYPSAPTRTTAPQSAPSHQIWRNEPTAKNAVTNLCAMSNRRFSVKFTWKNEPTKATACLFHPPFIFPTLPFPVTFPLPLFNDIEPIAELMTSRRHDFRPQPRRDDEATQQCRVVEEEQRRMRAKSVPPEGWPGNGPAASLSDLSGSTLLTHLRPSASHQAHFRAIVRSLVLQ